ncbi:MAG: hypothetical protein DCC55_15815 [Chloroflexi bacterium]|nr:MAG: hypothetical protein DCC55_15815 [Chloroflexota bacterium]
MDPQDHRLTALTQQLARLELLTPALCFLAGHRPLAFVAGQLLYLLEPLATLAGGSGLSAWAELLSDPRRLERLERIWSTQPSAVTECVEHYDHRE